MSQQELRRRLLETPADPDALQLHAVGATGDRRRRLTRRAIVTAPHSVGIWLDGASFELGTGDPTKVEADIRRAAILSPSDPSPYAVLHRCLGLILGEFRTHPQQRRAGYQALRTGPTSLPTRRMLGRLAFMRGDFSLAGRYFNTAYANGGDQDDLWLLALALLRSDDSSRLAKFLRTARNRWDARAVVGLTRGCVAARRGRYASAVRSIDAALLVPGQRFPAGPQALPRAGEIERVTALDPIGLYRETGLALRVAGDVGKVSDRPALIVSGNAVYLERFLDGFVASARRNAPGWPIHVHVIGGASAALRRHASKLADLCTQDVSRVAMDRAFFTVSRFLWLPKFLAMWNRALLVVDIDSQVIADPSPTLARCGNADLACRLADHVLPWERTQVTAIMVRPTLHARQFVRQYGALLASRIAREELPYYADQGLFWGLMNHLGAEPSGTRFADLELTPWLAAANAPTVSAKHLELTESTGTASEAATDSSGSG